MLLTSRVGSRKAMITRWNCPRSDVSPSLKPPYHIIDLWAKSQCCPDWTSLWRNMGLSLYIKSRSMEAVKNRARSISSGPAAIRLLASIGRSRLWASNTMPKQSCWGTIRWRAHYFRPTRQNRIGTARGWQRKGLFGSLLLQSKAGSLGPPSTRRNQDSSCSCTWAKPALSTIKISIWSKRNLAKF